MIVDLGKCSTKTEPFRNITQQSRQGELSSSPLGDLGSDSENMPVVGFSDCPHQQEDGSHGLRKKESWSSLLKSLMTGNLGSVKLSQLDHGSHCLPFLVDSSGLMVLLICVL